MGAQQTIPAAPRGPDTATLWMCEEGIPRLAPLQGTILEEADTCK